MATITNRTRKDGTKTYLVQIRIPGARSVSKTFDTPTEAKQFALHETQRLRDESERFCAPDPGRFNKELLVDVLDLFAARPSTTERYRAHIQSVKRIICPQTRIGELRPSWVERYVNKALTVNTFRGTPYTGKSVATHMTVMRQAYVWRSRFYDIEPKGIPFSQSYLPKGWNEGRDRRLSTSEEQTLMLAMDKKVSPIQWKALMTLAIETGARLQEMVLATWSEFNLVDRYWIIPKEHEKTRKERPVPLSSVAMKSIEQLRELHAGGPDERIFHGFHQPHTASQQFGRLVRKAGVVDFHFHDLRHEAISRMVLYRPQYTIFEIMKIVGHTSPAMLGRYANLRAKELADKMN